MILSCDVILLLSSKRTEQKFAMCSLFIMAEIFADCISHFNRHQANRQDQTFNVKKLQSEVFEDSTSGWAVSCKGQFSFP